MDSFLLEKFNDIEKTHWWWEGRRELIRNLLKGKKYERILDVGCGTGETLSFLKTIFPKAELYGIDTSSKAIKYTKSRGHRKVKRANALSLPFNDGFFDAVLILDVMEHIGDDLKVIKEAARTLKRGGRIIITAPALPFIWCDHDVNQGHKRRYTRRMIKYLAKRGGLRLSFISYFNFLFSLPIIIIRLLSRLKPFGSLSNYDNNVNFDIAHSKGLNSILRYLFVQEIRLISFLKYPVGISVAAVMVAL